MNLMADPKIRVLVAKPGLDGHDRGAKVIARALRDAGMEVIYTGLRQTPEMIVSASLQEDVNVIGLSILSGAHNAIVPRVMELLKQQKMDDVLVLVGGIIPDQDVDNLKKIGVAAIFQPGTAMDDIVTFIRANVKPRGVSAGCWAPIRNLLCSSSPPARLPGTGRLFRGCIQPQARTLSGRITATMANSPTW
jgi:methylmalonyl-CoA mutase C-terminal domain/subunit